MGAPKYQEIRIEENDGLLLVTLGHGESEYFLVSESLWKDFDFSKAQNIKFLGSLEAKNTIEMALPSKTLSLISRKLIITSATTVLYNVDEGRIKFDTTMVQPSAKRVLVIDDSATMRKLLCSIIQKSNQFRVVGTAESPSQARAFLEKNEVDVVTLDIHLPEMNGVDFLKTYLSFKNLTVVMISASTMEEGTLVLDALSSGAVSYIPKTIVNASASSGEEVLERLTEACSGKKIAIKNVKPQPQKFHNTDGLVVIGSSTGGTQALEHIFTKWPSLIPPVLVVQHIPPVFSKALAERLNRLCPFTVKEATDGEVLEANTIYIAPGGQHMKVRGRGTKRVLQITDDPPVNRFKPSVDYLFHSVSALKEKKVIGVILTGMGKDGARGLLSLKGSGAVTVAQDEKSSVVFGMPKEAIAIGAAQHVADLSEISNLVITKFNQL